MSRTDFEVPADRMENWISQDFDNDELSANRVLHGKT
jgi:hypothetical protein